MERPTSGRSSPTGGRPKEKSRITTAREIGRRGEPSEPYGFNTEELAAYDQGLATFDDEENARARGEKPPAAKAAGDKGGGGSTKVASHSRDGGRTPVSGHTRAAPRTPSSRTRSSWGTGGYRRTTSSGTGSSSIGVPSPWKWSAGDGSGALLGAVGFLLFTVYLKSGKAGVKAWLQAKLFNKVDGTSDAAIAGPLVGGGLSAGGTYLQGQGATKSGGTKTVPVVPSPAPIVAPPGAQP